MTIIGFAGEDLKAGQTVAIGKDGRIYRTDFSSAAEVGVEHGWTTELPTAEGMYWAYTGLRPVGRRFVELVDLVLYDNVLCVEKPDAYNDTEYQPLAESQYSHWQGPLIAPKPPE